MKKKLTMCLLLLCVMMTAAAAMAAEVQLYVSSSGSDGNAGTSAQAPIATLARAAALVNADTAGNDYVINVMSNLTSTACARFYNHDVTIQGYQGTAYTVARGEGFSSQSDNARSWYNPALIEVGGAVTGSPVASLYLKDIILDDKGIAQYTEADEADDVEGPAFIQAASNGTGSTEWEGKTYNHLQIVQDAMVATYNGTATVTLGSGAVLRNFGGASAVRIAGGELIMESGSVIEDSMSLVRGGGFGAVWSQGGRLTMQSGARIEDLNGRAVYLDGGSASIGGIIEEITANSKMHFATNGTAIHIRNAGTKATLIATGRIINIDPKGNDKSATSAVHVEGTEYEMVSGSVMNGVSNSGKAIQLSAGRAIVDGEITGITGSSGGNSVNMTGKSYLKIGPNGYIHDNMVWYGSIYMNGTNDELEIYGRIRNETSMDRGGALSMSNNFNSHKVTMYDGAEIAGNYSTQTGGGIMVACGTFTMEGGVITGNSAKLEGGGVYVRRGGMFVMNGGSVTNNTSETVGGGIAYVAGDYSPQSVLHVPHVKLNGGAVNGNRMNGSTSNDLAITADGYGYVKRTVNGKAYERYLQIGEGAVVGNEAVYFATNTKTVKADAKDVRYGNAGKSAIAAMQTASAGKGWGSKELASFWMQHDAGVTFEVGSVDGIASNLPVYAAVVPVDALGEAAGGVVFYNTTVAGNKVTFSVPQGYANGCGVAFFQPTADYGTAEIAGLDQLAWRNVSGYDVPYVADVSITQNLASLIGSDPSGSLTLRITLDSRLSIDGSVAVTSSMFDAGSASVSGNVVTVPLTLKAGAAVSAGSVASVKVNGQLPQSAFAAGDSLLTGCTLAIAGFGLGNTEIPGNVWKTDMVRIPIGDLRVTKTVVGGDVNRPFTFRVTLSDLSVSGTYGGMTFENGVAAFALTHGQSCTAYGLPANMRYEAAELDSADYVVAVTGAAGRIPADGMATAAFTNSLAGLMDKNPDDAELMPDTGDSSSMALWLALMLAGAMGAALMGRRKSRRG